MDRWRQRYRLYQITALGLARNRSSRWEASTAVYAYLRTCDSHKCIYSPPSIGLCCISLRSSPTIHHPTNRVPAFRTCHERNVAKSYTAHDMSSHPPNKWLTLLTSAPQRETSDHFSASNRLVLTPDQQPTSAPPNSSHSSREQQTASLSSLEALKQTSEGRRGRRCCRREESQAPKGYANHNRATD